jgi:hypothetical protein
VVESGGLENRCPFLGPGVRIPLSPIFLNGEERVSALCLQRAIFSTEKGVSFPTKRMERCESGRIGLPAKELCLYGHRGFESHPLRFTCP